MAKGSPKKPPISRKPTYQSPPVEPKSTWEWLKLHVRPLFRNVKIPGWVLVLWFVYQAFPDNKARLEYWAAELTRFGPIMVGLSSLLANPFFGYTVLILGILYLIFVGEAKRGKVVRPWVPYVAWSFCALLFLATIITSTAAITAANISPIRHLSADQKRAIQQGAAELAPHFISPDGKTMLLTVMAVDTPEASQYAEEIMQSFLAGGIVSQSIMQGYSAAFPMHVINMGVTGVFIQVKTPDKPTDGAVQLKNILESAHIPVHYAINPQLTDVSFILTVGLPQRDTA